MFISFMQWDPVVSRLDYRPSAPRIQIPTRTERLF